jgi:hypothetical protein
MEGRRAMIIKTFTKRNFLCWHKNKEINYESGWRGKVWFSFSHHSPVVRAHSRFATFSAILQVFLEKSLKSFLLEDFCRFMPINWKYFFIFSSFFILPECCRKFRSFFVGLRATNFCLLLGVGKKLEVSWWKIKHLWRSFDCWKFESVFWGS